MEKQRFASRMANGQNTRHPTSSTVAVYQIPCFMHPVPPYLYVGLLQRHFIFSNVTYMSINFNRKKKKSQYKKIKDMTKNFYQ